MTIRRRSQDHECIRCSTCLDALHHWMVESTCDADEDDEGDLPPEAITGEAGLFWVCKHCPIWMEMLADDDEEETDLDAAWNEAVSVQGSVPE